MARIVYMGTPAFAVPPLQALLEEGHEIVAVVTRPDRPAGRSAEPRPSPAKVFAQEHGLPLWQPVTLRRPEAVAHLRALAPQVIIVAAYGQMLPLEVLTIPPHGCLNIHASLLPRHRGASPVAAAILAGDPLTGVTLMQMEAGLDTGPIIAQEIVPLTGQERQGSLSAHLSEVGASLLRRVLPAWLAGEIVPRPQEEAQATYSSVLRKEDGAVDWSRPASYIERMVRAYDPWPGTYTFLHGRRLRIWRARVLAGESPYPAGTIFQQGATLLVTTGEGLLALEEVQMEGKRRLSAADFLAGLRRLPPTQLERSA